MRCAAALVASLVLAAAMPAMATEVEDGKILFERQCAACHTIGSGDRVGPDLAGATERRPRDWLLNFVTAPERMIADGDPVATRLFEQYNRIVMPNLNLTREQAGQLLAYLAEAGQVAAAPARPVSRMPQPSLAPTQRTILSVFLAIALVIALVFGWVGLSTHSPTTVDVHRAYAIRRVLFIVALAGLGSLLFVTLARVPYARASVQPSRVVYVTARQFDFIFSEEPIVSVEDLGRVSTQRRLTLERGELVEFRVTSLDVNHGFGLYGPDRQIVVQTQAMPGYFNRLRFQPAVAGEYEVICLEYCAAGHHLMQTRLTVN